MRIEIGDEGGRWPKATDEPYRERRVERERPDKPREPSEAMEKLADFGEATLDFLRDSAQGIVMGAAVGGIIYAGASLDNLLNPEIIEAIRSSPNWWKYLTSDHAMTSVILDNPLAFVGIPTVVGWLGNVIAKRVDR